MDRAMLPLVIKQRLALSDFTFIEVSPSWIIIIMQHYNLLIYFQSAYLVGGGDKFASPYMASQKPLLVTIFKNYNAKSIKPNHYSYGKFNNYKLRYANKKGKGQSDLVLSTLPFCKQNVRTL